MLQRIGMTKLDGPVYLLAGITSDTDHYPTLMDTYDFIVVGGSSAGSVRAAFQRFQRGLLEEQAKAIA